MTCLAFQFHWVKAWALLSFGWFDLDFVGR